MSPLSRLTAALCALFLCVLCAACTPVTLPLDHQPPGVWSSAADVPDRSASPPEPTVPDGSTPEQPSVPAIAIPQPAPPDASRPTQQSQPPAPTASQSKESVMPAPDQSLPQEPVFPGLFQSDAPIEPAPDPSQPEDPEFPVSDAYPSEGPAEPAPSYDFSQPVPEGDPVENGYFADAAFIGDSRTDGFYLFSGVKQGKNLSSNGISVFTLNEKKAVKIDGESYTLLEALSLAQYGKVYLALGVNELGYHNNETFYDAYCQAIDAIRACQPNAVIYVQSLIPLNEQRVAATGGGSFLKNDRLRTYNELIRQAAQDKQVAFLDLYSAFAVDGSLPADASRDGVHLSADYCRRQLEYLKRHTVPFDTLYPPVVPEPPHPEEMEAPSHAETTDHSDVDTAAGTDSLHSRPHDPAPL